MGILEKLEAKKLSIEAEFNSKIEVIEANAAQQKGEVELLKSSQLNELAEMEIQLAIDLKAAEDKGFDLGLAQAGIPATDKIYTEADLQAEKELVAKPFLAQVALLEGKVAELQSAVDSIPAMIAAEVKTAKAQLLEKIKATKADDNSLVAELEAETAG